MSSKSSSDTTTNTEDNRIIADGEGIAVNSDGGAVSLHMVPDEAFDLAELAVGTTAATFSDALERTQEHAQSESKQLAEQVIKIGIPALAVAFIAGKIFK